MSTIKELFNECIGNDYSFMAHALYYLLQEGLVVEDDPQTVLDHVDMDVEVVGEWTEKNILGIAVEKVYSLKVSKDAFLFVFAKDPEQAEAFIKKEWGINPLNCHEYPLDTEMVRGKEIVSFREMKKDFLTFPALIGYYKKNPVYQL